MRKFSLACLDREGVNPEELKKEAEVIVKLGQHQNVIHVYGYCIEKKCQIRKKSREETREQRDYVLYRLE